MSPYWQEISVEASKQVGRVFMSKHRKQFKLTDKCHWGYLLVRDPVGQMVKPEAVSGSLVA